MLETRRILLAKVETTYGIDPGLTGAADAILIEDLKWEFSGAKMYERNPVKASHAPLKPIYGGSLMQISGKVEIKGSGVAGTAPEVGTLLRGCRYGETVSGGVSVAYSPVSGASESLTLYEYHDGTLKRMTGVRGNVAFELDAGSSGQATFTLTGHTKMRGTAQAGGASTITLASTYSATNDVYNGQKITITSGTGAGQSKTISAYVGATKVATVSVAWSVVPDSTSIYEIDNGPWDAALVTPTFDATVPVPLIALPFSIDSYAAVISKLAFDTGGKLSMPPDISAPDGFGQIQLIGRAVTGSFDPEAVLVATQDFVGKWKGGNAMALDTGVIGTTAGNRYRVQMPAVTYTGAAKGEREGVSAFDMPFMAAETTTDNEVTITFT